MISVGQKAPAFKLFNTDKQEVSLEDYKGKVLTMLFFPMAFTSTCTAELCEVRDNMASYKSLNSEVVGISVDSVFTLKKFKEEQNLDFPLLSDFNKEASFAYDSVIVDFVLGMKNVSRRASFVIDKEGVVRFAEVLPNAGDYPSMDKISAAIASLK